MICWHKIFDQEEKKEYFQYLMENYEKSRLNSIIYPAHKQLFRAFELSDFESIKVVILGQDPYHQPGQANGLAFSVPKSTKIPPSLTNIYKALHFDLDIPPAPHGELSAWAQQGVFLLNCLLSVTHQQPESAKKLGWETFTDRIIQILSREHSYLVFFLWGKYAQKKIKQIDEKKHLILTSAHPSPLSAYRGFLNCQHFSKANEILVQNGLTPINWDLNDT
jgi:uracil-DNA glycosylase